MIRLIQFAIQIGVSPKQNWLFRCILHLQQKISSIERFLFCQFFTFVRLIVREYNLCFNSCALIFQKLAKGSRWLKISPVEGLPQRFQGESNGAIKIFESLILNLLFTGRRTGSDVINVANRLFKALTGYTVSDHLCTNT